MCFSNYQNTYTGSSSVIFLLQINQTPLEGKGGGQDGQERGAEWRGSTEQRFCDIVAERGGKPVLVRGDVQNKECSRRPNKQGCRK